MPGGLLNRKQDRGGLLSAPTTIRQISTPFGSPGAPQFAGMGGAGQGGEPAYGSDEWALKYGGPGALFWRELYRGFKAHPDDPVMALAPGSNTFSGLTAGLLDPRYRKKGK